MSGLVSQHSCLELPEEGDCRTLVDLDFIGLIPWFVLVLENRRYLFELVFSERVSELSIKVSTYKPYWQLSR